MIDIGYILAVLITIIIVGVGIRAMLFELIIPAFEWLLIKYAPWIWAWLTDNDASVMKRGAFTFLFVLLFIAVLAGSALRVFIYGIL